MKRVQVQDPSGKVFDFETWRFEVSEQSLRDIIEGRGYPTYNRPHDVRTVLDIGANVGAYSVYAAWSYPGARVISYEPNPETFRVLERNAAIVGRIEAVNKAAWHSDGAADLHIGKIPECDAIEANQMSTACSTRVSTTKFPKVLDLYRPDVLKFDAEGAEEQCFPIARDGLADVRWIHVECHGQKRREAVEWTLAQSHALAYARVVLPDLCEFTYVRRDLVGK